MQTWNGESRPSTRFFPTFLKFSGIVEMVIAVCFFFFEPIATALAIPVGIPLFYLFAAVEFIVLGFLLWYSARDICRYTIIIYASCVFRYLMVIPELTTILRFPAFTVPLIAGLAYDWISATLTLIFLKKYLKKSSPPLQR